MDNCVSVMTKILRLYKFTIPIAEPVGITFTTSSLLLSNKYNGAYRVLLGGGHTSAMQRFIWMGLGKVTPYGTSHAVHILPRVT